MKLSALILFTLSVCANAQTPDKAAAEFLSSLNKKQKLAATYPLDDPERFNWHFVPRARNGACFRDFNDTQRSSAIALIRSSLSNEGFSKATNIMALETILREIEGRSSTDNYRDPLNYYITVLGDPSDTAVWGWRLEGHHLAFNFMLEGNKVVSSTPSFFGSNPAIVPSGREKGKEILRMETQLGLQLVNSFNDEAKKKAIISVKAFPDILSFNSRTAMPLAPAGILFSEMTKNQQETFMQLLNIYIRNYELGFSEKLSARIRSAGIENLSFAWAGALTDGSGTYYRIQGPMLLIEYDNTQNNGNHIHTTVRDLTNDFAEDFLKEHYMKEHKK